MRTLLRPSLDRTRLLFLRDPPPLDMPPPSKGFKTSVCVCEWQTLCGEELREEGGVADVIWEIEKNGIKCFYLSFVWDKVHILILERKIYYALKYTGSAQSLLGVWRYKLWCKLQETFAFCGFYFAFTFFLGVGTKVIGWISKKAHDLSSFTAVSLLGEKRQAECDIRHIYVRGTLVSHLSRANLITAASCVQTLQTSHYD